MTRLSEFATALLRGASWLAAATVWLVAAPPLAGAHEFWLAPSSYRGAAGDTVAVRAFIGTGFRGELKPFATPRAVRLELREGSRRDLAPAAINGDLVFARLALRDAGGALVVYQSNNAFIELEGGQFDAYLKLEGLAGPLAERARKGASAGPGRELYSRCGKTWIAGRDAGRVLKPVGLPLEIVPLDDPAKSSRLRVRVIYRGKPLAGALVRAWNRGLERGAVPADAAARDSVPPVFEGRTDVKGLAVVPTDHAGEWLLSTVHMVPSGATGVAEWESVWSSLTYARIAGGSRTTAGAPP